MEEGEEYTHHMELCKTFRPLNERWFSCSIFEMDPFEVCSSLGHQLKPMNIALPFYAIF